MIINKAKPENGIIVGRFQPFHLEHLRFAVAAASRVNHLWVGITRPFGSYIQESGGARTTASANPLPYWLRFKCVETALLHDAGIPRDEFSILPAPLVPEILEQLVPKGSIFLTTIVNEWSVQKEELFLKAGFPAIRIDFVQYFLVTRFNSIMNFSATSSRQKTQQFIIYEVWSCSHRPFYIYLFVINSLQRLIVLFLSIVKVGSRKNISLMPNLSLHFFISAIMFSIFLY